MAVIDELDRSNRSVVDFAKEHAIPSHVLYSWRRRLDDEKAQAARHAKAPAFVPVRVVDDQPPASAREGLLEVVHPAGFVIRLQGPVDAQRLTTVVRVLGQQRC